MYKQELKDLIEEIKYLRSNSSREGKYTHDYYLDGFDFAKEKIIDLLINKLKKF